MVNSYGDNIYTVSVMVEVPKGSRNKYEYDKIRRRIKLDRMLFSSVHYPCDYGFVEDSLALDGDALDALVLLWEPTFPGCIIKSKPLGMFVMSDEKGPDEKILCVPVADPLWNHIEELKEVPPHLLKEIEHFFSIYKKLEEKDVEVFGWCGIEETLTTIEESKDRFKKALRSGHPMYE
ncbi:MAG: inorganic diphosphatase [Deltaproteobacteria bacterium]|nr:inorganic diphosphatase [Deltaproteobacteria bacterium]